MDASGRDLGPTVVSTLRNALELDAWVRFYIAVRSVRDIKELPFGFGIREYVLVLLPSREERSERVHGLMIFRTSGVEPSRFGEGGRLDTHAP